MSDIKIIKFIAPKVMAICGRSSSWTIAPCECTDTITCAYCVQASLLMFEKKFKDNDVEKKKIISYIRKNGIRKTAREMNRQPSTVQYWFRTDNFPQQVLNKYAECTNSYTNTHTP